MILMRAERGPDAMLAGGTLQRRKTLRSTLALGARKLCPNNRRSLRVRLYARTAFVRQYALIR
jgi:hypothetical protein